MSYDAIYSTLFVEKVEILYKMTLVTKGTGFEVCFKFQHDLETSNQRNKQGWAFQGC